MTSVISCTLKGALKKLGLKVLCQFNKYFFHFLAKLSKKGKKKPGLQIVLNWTSIGPQLVLSSDSYKLLTFFNSYFNCQYSPLSLAFLLQRKCVSQLETNILKGKLVEGRRKNIARSQKTALSTYRVHLSFIYNKDNLALVSSESRQCCPSPEWSSLPIAKSDGSYLEANCCPRYCSDWNSVECTERKSHSSQEHIVRNHTGGFFIWPP